MWIDSSRYQRNTLEVNNSNLHESEQRVHPQLLNAPSPTPSQLSSAAQLIAPGCS